MSPKQAFQATYDPIKLEIFKHLFADDADGGS